jgi:programmed cell death 6-interacting protein
MQKIEPAQFENLFEERLQRYDGDLKALSEEQEEQRRISNQLVEANAAFVKARQGDTSTKQREQALQRLEVGYLKYKEVVSNLDAARQFYNDLATLVSRFRDECQKFAYQRRMEAGQLEAYVPVAHILLSFENLSPVASVHNTDDPRASGAISDLSTALSSLSLHNTAQLQDRRERESLRSHYQPPAPADEPLTAPTPTRPVVAPHPPVSGIWSPEMGIKFESGPAAEGLGGAGAGRVGGNAPAAQGLSGNDSRNLKYPDAGQGTRGPLDMSRGVRFG